MASSAFLKLLWVVLMGMLVLSHHAEAQISCNLVTSKLTPCLGYVRGRSLNPGCCPGIRSLYSLANNTPKRRSVCVCLKNIAAGFGNNVSRAKSLLIICRVRLPYPLDPRIDCSRVN